MNTLFPSPQFLRPASPERVAHKPKAISAPKRILLVDDDAVLSRLCAVVLSNAGYAVETADDGRMGWDALQAAHYDLLITDHQMPHLNGLELAARARLSDSRLPIIMISGWFDPLQVPDRASLNVADVLTKPFAVSDLIRAVEFALAESIDGARTAAESAPRHSWGAGE
jgi:DNA-binding response OmpR family regulator